MSKQLTYQLFQLIQNLTKAEKRHFKLYAKRNLGDKDMKFITLFEVIDKMKEYDEDKVLKKLPHLKGSVLSNLKAHLYEQLLVSLRLLNHKDAGIRAGEMISFAYILYQKGLYRQSLHMLGRAKNKAIEKSDNILLLEIIEFEKTIESRHITRSHEQRAEELINASKALRETLKSEGEWSDLALKLYDLYLKTGHTKNKLEFDEVAAFFYSNLPKQKDELSFFGEIHKQQCYVWYYYITQDFVKCYRYTKVWIDAFTSNPKMMKLEPELYMKGVHNCLSVLFYCNEPKRFNIVFQQLNNFIKENQANFSKNCNVQAFIYYETALLNSFFIQGKFTEGTKEIEGFENRLSTLENGLDEHRKLIFWYKIGCMYFGSGNYKLAAKYLQKIINNSTDNLREDVQCFARILNLVTHYEMGNNDVVDYQLRATYRYLLKMEDMQKVQKAILNFIKSSVYMNRRDMLIPFMALRRELESILDDQYEWRPLLYLDLLSWLESKIENVPVEEVIRKKQEIR